MALVLIVHLYLGFGDLIQVIRIVWWPSTRVSVNAAILGK